MGYGMARNLLVETQAVMEGKEERKKKTTED